MRLANTALLIHGGRVLDPSQSIDRVARLLIVDGQIAAIDPVDGDVPEATRTIDVTGKLVMPGLVDMATEWRQPGFEEDETIASGSAAALAGGYTTVVLSSNNDPCTDSPGAVEFIRQKAAAIRGPHVHVMACVSQGRTGEQMAELGVLCDAGATAFSDAPRPIARDALLKRALEYCRMFDRVIIDRPGVPELSKGGVMHDGKASLVLGLTGIPTEAEDLAVARDVRLAEATGGRLHVGPISTMGAIDMIGRAKGRGIAVTASACPHNLNLADEELRSFDARFKVHPPLRSPRHIDAINRAIASGVIDVIQSGHMPRSREKKLNDLDTALFGASSLETTLAVVATDLVAENVIDWPTVVRRMALRPSEILGLHSGTLQPGRSADVTIVDPQNSWKVQGDTFKSLSPSTPMEGRTLHSKVVLTIVNGEIMYEDDGSPIVEAIA